ALVAGCATGAGGSTSGRSTTSGPPVTPGLGSALASIPHRSVAPMPPARLAKGLVPPTNRWFSGLVFGNSPQPVFPLPLSFALTGTGFAFGVPAVTTSADTITGEFSPAITIGNASVSSEITAYDEASVTIAQKSADGATIGSVVIAEGSPVVSYTAERASTLGLGGNPQSSGGGLFETSAGGSSYGLLTKGKVNGAALHLAKGQTAVWFAVPHGSDAAHLAPLVSVLKSVSLGYSVSGKRASTTLTYHSVGKTLVAAMPHQSAALRAPKSCALGSYPSIYGTLSLCRGPVLSWDSPRVTASSSLDSARLSDSDKSVLRDQLSRDIQSTKPLPADSYFGGKALYRLANLLSVAHAIGDTAAAATVQKKLDAALEKWTTPNGCVSRSSQCFVYDPKAKGIVGLTASFGSDQFNDHHFHYGYFLYAASVAARYEPSVTSRIEPVINLLAADLASSGGSSSFPERRTFDAYAGHSWASGYAPFADGNNQESSSEAVDAWNGLSLWAATTKNAALETEANWMLSAEAASATAYWTNFNTAEPVYSGYQHGVVGINWGGKRDYASWFSADASAKLGIQLIPMSPASGYLAGDSKRIAKNIAEAAPDGYDVQFGDYLLMYSALEGRASAAAALAKARQLPDKFIDDADSRSYLLAWIMTR
ncbi:MAG: endo,3(4)-beta-glucanase, partial [Actinomycetota bacterium]|nr:endo,3(4)-beta-glucanase [Actinomycetota bacterium]